MSLRLAGARRKAVVTFTTASSAKFLELVAPFVHPSMVLPDEVDDIQAQVLARDIAKEYEEELTYPGQIKVVVVRESRSTEVAR